MEENSKNCMHWNVLPDALLGSAMLVYVLDRWLMDWLVDRQPQATLFLGVYTPYIGVGLIESLICLFYYPHSLSFPLTLS